MTDKTRIFLVVVDETEEMTVALHYAARRARTTGGKVALLHVIPPSELQHWGAIEELMKQEQREEAEQLMQRLAKEVVDIAGSMPMLYIRDGQASEQLMKLIQEEPSISILVLAAGTGRGGPGPLISFVVGQMAGSLRIPVTVVPGYLSDEQLDAIT
ncbi:universal stress protein [Niveispirillum cyanobacteriorum]|uniref:Universal stress protein n=1 Tax=Niveispirillum cyanobacteriorum TaxID=1612173 RepID=A0A2K9NCT3_9PROT|nr:universal stress protein [Niveispirillum cyanobacteriorum]AUN30928.1 universal stress protein [Niveispirillum cyanobacteriorum]GGE80866.1 universal stress protein [Niveispirillum cyanobacteriorum]